MDNTLYTVAVFSENRVGLLNQISIIFTRRKLNIESLSVSPSSIKGVHKITITAYSDEETIEKLVKQIEKRIDVLKAFYYTDNEIVYQEIALYKVPTKNLIEEQNLEKIIRNAEDKFIKKNVISQETFSFLDTYENLFSDKLEVKYVYQDAVSGEVLPFYGDTSFLEDSTRQTRISLRVAVKEPSKKSNSLVSGFITTFSTNEPNLIAL